MLISLPLSVLKYFSGKFGMNDFTHYVSFLYLILLFVPFFKKKWKIIIIVICFISIFYDLKSRSNILNFGFISILFFLAIFKNLNTLKYLKKIRVFLLFLPFFLVTLSFFGLNIFVFFDEYKTEYSIKGKDNLDISMVNDSRTGVYLDAWNGVTKENNLIFGISAAGYHDTFLKDIFDGSNLKNGRLGSEVGILEYLLRGGLVFVLVIVLLHYFASKLAIYKSNNLLCKFLGVYISFRLFFLFIEAQVSFNLSNISTFLALGLCLNQTFRNFTNNEMKTFLNRIFYKM
ncbi:hypothetical protein ACFQ5N_10320 [Lutibacter holmesii]|uniref:O-antigen ligase domain-containing protein n=1 Tax=Lutibacter holmesii TaxID=1137985 RepID=A0ABW3WP98_9FLAO